MRNIYIIPVIVVFSILSSCNKWLDITPKGNAEASEMLSTENGYNAALGGVYYLLTTNSLYGRELTYGMMDVLAQYWDLTNQTTHTYYKQSLYDYKDATTVSRIEKVWSTMYKAVAQINLILESLEQNRDKIKYSELIEGEALALRAFIHMELANLFGPVIKSETDLDKNCIAYRTKFNTEALKFESFRAIMQKVKADLNRAIVLMDKDPIIDNPRYLNGNSSMLDYNSVLDRRGSRMNYYGAKALLMRVELSLLNKNGAYLIAKDLIETFKTNDRFTLVTSTRDLNYGAEMLSAMYKNDLWSEAAKIFINERVESSKQSLVITPAHYSTILNHIYGRTPDGAGTDRRLNYWFEKAQSSFDYYYFTKYKEVQYQGLSRLAYYPEIPIVRLSEVYFTACETMVGTDNKLALEYLNEVRKARNLPDLEEGYSSEEILDFMLREMRKDFIGEGRMFITYKRLFQSFYVKQGIIIAASDDKFVFPIPDSEYEYSPNEKPTTK